MLAGSLVFIFAQRSKFPIGIARVGHYLGFLLIALAIFGADTFDYWPGLPALLPVTGAALIVLAGYNGPLVSGRAWQWLGDNSYSIYLWHWPIMVLLGNADLFAQPRSFRDRAPLAIIARLPNEPPPCNRAFPTSSTPPRKS